MAVFLLFRHKMFYNNKKKHFTCQPYSYFNHTMVMNTHVHFKKKVNKGLKGSKTYNSLFLWPKTDLNIVILKHIVQTFVQIWLIEQEHRILNAVLKYLFHIQVRNSQVGKIYISQCRNPYSPSCCGMKKQLRSIFADFIFFRLIRKRFGAFYRVFMAVFLLYGARKLQLGDEGETRDSYTLITLVHSHHSVGAHWGLTGHVPSFRIIRLK